MRTIINPDDPQVDNLIAKARGMQFYSANSIQAKKVNNPQEILEQYIKTENREPDLELSVCHMNRYVLSVEAGEYLFFI